MHWWTWVVISQKMHWYNQIRRTCWWKGPVKIWTCKHCRAVGVVKEAALLFTRTIWSNSRFRQQRPAKAKKKVEIQSWGLSGHLQVDFVTQVKYSRTICTYLEGMTECKDWTISTTLCCLKKRTLNCLNRPSPLIYLLGLQILHTAISSW